MVAGGGGYFRCRRSLEATINHTCSVVPPARATRAQRVALSPFPANFTLCYSSSVPRESCLEAIWDSTYVLSSQRSWMEGMRAHLGCAWFSHHGKPPAKNMQGRMEYKKITPNLIVKDVSASLAFYEEVLGLPRAILVPDKPPFVFGSVTAGGIEIFFNQQAHVSAEATEFSKELGSRPIGGSFTMFIEVEG